jgi:hypothetical protein
VCKAAKALLGIGVFALGLGLFSTAQGDGLAEGGEQEPISTNFDLLRRVVEEAIDEACDRLPLHEPEVFCLGHDAEAPGNWLVEGALIRSLRQRDHQVLLPDTSQAQSPPACIGLLTLRYRLVELNLLYPASRRKHLFGPRLVKRLARLHLFLRLKKENGEVLWTGEAQQAREDWIPAKMLSVVELKPLPFISPRLKPDGWGRFAEPVLLSAAVGGLIYLFYSTQ